MFGVSIKEKETLGSRKEYKKYLRMTELKRLVVDRAWAQSSEVLQNFCFITKSTLFLFLFLLFSFGGSQSTSCWPTNRTFQVMESKLVPITL